MQANIKSSNLIGYEPAGKFEETRFEKIHNIEFDQSLISAVKMNTHQFPALFY